MPTCPNPRHSRFQQERPVDAAVTMAYVIEPLHSLDLILHVIQPKKDPSHTFKDIFYVLKKITQLHKVCCSNFSTSHGKHAICSLD